MLPTVHDELLSGRQLLYRCGVAIRRCPRVHYGRVGLHLEPGAAGAGCCEGQGDPCLPRWEDTICARLREGATPDADGTLALVGRVHAGAQPRAGTRCNEYVRSRESRSIKVVSLLASTREITIPPYQALLRLSSEMSPSFTPTLS